MSGIDMTKNTVELKRYAFWYSHFAPLSTEGKAVTIFHVIPNFVWCTLARLSTLKPALIVGVSQSSLSLFHSQKLIS
jgi:hypothetical protein